MSEYHPFFDDYLNSSLLALVEPDAKKLVQKGILKALSSSPFIMDLHWVSIKDACEKYGPTPGYEDIDQVCSLVYFYGWDHNQDTKWLEGLFRSFITPIKKSLEDYL